MAYTITSMQSAPDVGFRSLSRHTAEGATELAATLTAEGAIEIEIRDDRGNLCTTRDLREEALGQRLRERDVMKQLAPALRLP